MKLYKNLSSALKEREEVRALKITVKDTHFPQELFDFPDLTELYLDGNCQSFNIKTPAWEKLKILSLKWPQFTGDLSFLFSLPQLENLKIIETPLKKILLPLGMAIAPLKSLTMKGCNLNELPEEISMLVHLEELNLTDNRLKNLPYSFRSFKKLSRLNLDHNDFYSFPNFIKNISSLKHLSIDGNSFSEDEKARIQREFHIWVS